MTETNDKTLVFKIPLVFKPLLILGIVILLIGYGILISLLIATPTITLTDAFTNKTVLVWVGVVSSMGGGFIFLSLVSKD